MPVLHPLVDHEHRHLHRWRRVAAEEEEAAAAVAAAAGEGDQAESGGAGDDDASGAPLWHRDFTAIVAARGISNIGTSLSVVTIGYLIVTATSSAVWIAAVGTTFTAAFALGGLVDSLLGDRVSARRILVIGQLVEVCSIAAILVLWWTDNLSGPALVVMSVATGFVGAFEFPAWQIMLRATVDRSNVARAVAAYGSTKSVANLTGSLLGAALLTGEYVTVALVIDLASYLPVFASLVITRKAPLPGEPVRGTDTATSDTTDAADVSDDHPLSRAFRFAMRNRAIRWAILTNVVLSLLIGPLSSMLPNLVTWLGEHPGFLGFLSAALYFGQALQAQVIGWSQHRARTGVVVAVVSVAAAFVLILIGAAQHPSVAIAGLVAFGAALGSLQSLLLTVVDTSTPPSLANRVISIDVLCFSLGGAVGVVLWGWLTHRNSFGLAVVLSGLIAAGFIAAAFATRRIRALDQEDAAAVEA